MWNSSKPGARGGKCGEISFTLDYFVISVFAKACLITRGKEEGSRSKFWYRQMNPGMQDLLSLGVEYACIFICRGDKFSSPHSIILPSASTTLVKISVPFSSD